MFSALNKPEEKLKKLQSSADTAIYIDVCTGLEVSKNGDDTGTSFPGKATKERAKQRLHMQNQAPENQDFAQQRVASCCAGPSYSEYWYTFVEQRFCLHPARSSAHEQSNWCRCVRTERVQSQRPDTHFGKRALGRVLYGTTCNPPGPYARYVDYS